MKCPLPNNMHFLVVRTRLLLQKVIIPDALGFTYVVLKVSKVFVLEVVMTIILQIGHGS